MLGVRLCCAALVLFPAALAAAPPADPIRQFAAPDYRGRDYTLDDFTDDSLLVVAFLGTECPLVKLYAGRLEEFQQQYASRGVRVVGVMSNRQDSMAEIAAFARRHDVTYPLLKDAGNKIADLFEAERTPEVFVLDAQRRVRYRGRIDDQYGVSHVRDEPRSQDLRSAVDALLAGRDVPVPRTEAVGCIIGRRRQPEPEPDVTFTRDVAPILNRRCVECHREGEIAPFALSDYAEVSGWADMIAEVVRDGRMPPWHANPEHGRFANDRSLDAEEQETLYRWAEAGAPEGDPADLPEPPSFVAGWQLASEPDRVVPVSPEPFDVPAEGAVAYQYFRVDPEFREDRWLKSAELLPGNRAVVHHILAFAVPPGSRRLEAQRGFLAGYVPGARVESWPAGMAKRIPAGSELVFQVHYTPIGTPQEDQSQLGLVFADPEEVTHEVVTSSVLQTRLRIPPGDAEFAVEARPERLPEGLLLGFSPHMHLRGKSFRYELQEPGAEREVLLDVPNYDFNWQTTYVLAEPRAIEPGSRMHASAVFDNSDENLNNPDPGATVSWGDQTWNEMMIGYFHVAVPLDAGGSSAAADEAVLPARLERLFRRLDRDGDGRLTRGEVPAKHHATFDRVDADGDAVVTAREMAAL